MTLTAIVPVWNGENLLRRLLASLQAQTCPIDELLVVDNGSQDAAPDVARQAGARVISMGRNAGFAAAVNRGIREARGQWIAVLNSDVELSPDYLERLAARLASTDDWFATGRIFIAGSKSHLDATFDLVCRGGTAYRFGSGHLDGPEFATARSIWSAPWTAAMFRASLFQKLGVLEETYESYLEDVDFGLRCARHGMSGAYVPEAVAWHRGSASLGRWHSETVRHISRNQVFLLARHFPKESLRRHAGAIGIAHFLWGCLALRHGAGIAWLRGKWQGMRAWNTVRYPDPFPAATLERLLAENESLIRTPESGGMQDLYWRMYFLLSRPGAK